MIGWKESRVFIFKEGNVTRVAFNNMPESITPVLQELVPSGDEKKKQPGTLEENLKTFYRVCQATGCSLASMCKALQNDTVADLKLLTAKTPRNQLNQFFLRAFDGGHLHESYVPETDNSVEEAVVLSSKWDQEAEALAKKKKADKAAARAAARAAKVAARAAKVAVRAAKAPKKRKRLTMYDTDSDEDTSLELSKSSQATGAAAKEEQGYDTDSDDDTSSGSSKSSQEATSSTGDVVKPHVASNTEDSASANVDISEEKNKHQQTIKDQMAAQIAIMQGLLKQYDQFQNTPGGC